jgi:hypothetical protein
MFARVTQLELDPSRTDVQTALERFRETVLPELREEDGYAGVYVMATTEGHGLIISLWETEEEARAGVTLHGERLERYVTLFKSPPGRELYDVQLVDLPVRV